MKKTSGKATGKGRVREPQFYQELLGRIDYNIATAVGGRVIRHYQRLEITANRHHAIISIPEQDENQVVAYTDEQQELADQAYAYCFKGDDFKPKLPPLRRRQSPDAAKPQITKDEKIARVVDTGKRLA